MLWAEARDMTMFPKCHLQQKKTNNPSIQTKKNKNHCFDLDLTSISLYQTRFQHKQRHQQSKPTYVQYSGLGDVCSSSTKRILMHLVNFLIHLPFCIFCEEHVRVLTMQRAPLNIHIYKCGVQVYGI